MAVHDVTWRRLCLVANVPVASWRRWLAEWVMAWYEQVDWECEAFHSFTKYGCLLVMRNRRHPERRFSTTLHGPTDWRVHHDQ